MTSVKSGHNADATGRAAWYADVDGSAVAAAAAAAGADVKADAIKVATPKAGAAVKSGNGTGAVKQVVVPGASGPAAAAHQVRTPFIIGVTGGSASGKTTVCDRIVERLNLPWVVCLSMDSFYRPLTAHEMENVKDHDFDAPTAFDWATMRQCLADIRAMRSVQIPRYDFKTHSRLPESDTVYGADVVLVEGILVLHDEQVRDLFDMKIFVETDGDFRFKRRILRDVKERGRSVEGVLDQYMKTVKPGYDKFIAPTRRFADIIIPYDEHNHVAVDLLTQAVRTQLELRGVQFVKRTASAALESGPNSPTAAGAAAGAATNASDAIMPSCQHFHLLPETKAVQAILTIIRDRTAKQEELQFAVARLCRLLFSFGMKLALYEPVTVTTPTGAPFTGTALSKADGGVCAVTIVRAGEALERTFRESFPEVGVGKIVITQNSTDKKADGPRLFYSKLPKGVQSFRRVLLMDAVLATANAAIMAVHVLLDHGVREENIVYYCLTAAPQGVNKLLRAHPKLNVCAAAAETGLNDNGFVVPGVGALGDRFFGTDEAPAFVALFIAAAAAATAAGAAKK